MIAAPGKGMLSLMNHREVSPAPVSSFALFTQSNNMRNNRVTIPFKRTFRRLESGSVFDSLKLKRAASEYWQENFKLSSKTKDSDH